MKKENLSIREWWENSDGAELVKIIDNQLNKKYKTQLHFIKSTNSESNVRNEGNHLNHSNEDYYPPAA